MRVCGVRAVRSTWLRPCCSSSCRMAIKQGAGVWLSCEMRLGVKAALHLLQHIQLCAKIAKARLVRLPQDLDRNCCAVPPRLRHAHKPVHQTEGMGTSWSTAWPAVSQRSSRNAHGPTWFSSPPACRSAASYRKLALQLQALQHREAAGTVARPAPCAWRPDRGACRYGKAGTTISSYLCTAAHSPWPTAPLCARQKKDIGGRRTLCKAPTPTSTIAR